MSTYTIYNMHVMLIKLNSIISLLVIGVDSIKSITLKESQVKAKLYS